MKRWNWLGFAVLCGLAADSFISYGNRTPDKWDFNPFRLVAFILLFSASFYFHGREKSEKCLREKKAGERIWCYDYLRILAVFLVVGVHAIDKAVPFAEDGSFVWKLLVSASALSLICNQLYVMISGGLLLGRKVEHLASFYWNRFLKAAVPLFAYYLIYKAVHGGLENLYPKNWPELFLQIISGPFDGAPHFWLIYVILSLYLITPFVGIMLVSLPCGMLRGLICLILLFQAAAAYLPGFPASAGISFIFSSWTGVFIFGYFLSRPESLRWRCPLAIAGIASAVITVWGTLTLGDTSALVNTAPTMTFMAGAVYAGVMSLDDKLKRPGRILSAISKYSYSMILIHWYVLYYLVGDRFLIIFNGNALPIGCAVTALAVMSVSFLFAWVYDYLVVFLMQAALSYLPRLLKGLK